MLSGALFTAFIYLQILIRDLDNPFDYEGHSSADVSLEIIKIILNKMQKSYSFKHEQD